MNTWYNRTHGALGSDHVQYYLEKTQQTNKQGKCIMLNKFKGHLSSVSMTVF